MAPSTSRQRNVTRLQALCRWLFTLTAGMGTSSPAEVLRNLIRILEGASPSLRLAIALATPWAMLVGALASYGRVWQALNTARAYVGSSIYASVRIPGTHSLQKQVLAYVVEQGLGKDARALTLSPPQRDHKQMMMSYMYPYDNIYGRGGQHQKQRHAEPDSEKPPLSYVPQVGSYSFWWRGIRITLRQESREYEEKDSHGRYHVVVAAVADIELSCISLFGGAGPLRDFLRFVQNIPTTERTTTIYRPQSTAWDAGIVQSARSLNAVTMTSTIKDALVRDVETFLDPATKNYYRNRGIPYRRGFLFYGPPGTGKTSFANAIAGHFILNVYMISLSTKTLSDDMLEALFEQLPNKCIVLLEDIDSAGLKRESMRRKNKQSKKRKEGQQAGVNIYGDPIYVPPTTGITLSGLLNVLDGIHSREGMITIMTSNTPDSLDPALLRPGRVDRKVLFSYASHEVSAKLFRHIFEKTEEERVAGETTGSEHNMAKLAEEFANTIAADKLTPGDVQGFLLVHRADPTAAIAQAKEWAEKTLEIKAKGANVAAFEGAIAQQASAPSNGSGGTIEEEITPVDSVNEEEGATSEDTYTSEDMLQATLADVPPAPIFAPSYGCPATFSGGRPWSTTQRHYLGGLPSATSTYSSRAGYIPTDMTSYENMPAGVIAGTSPFGPTPPYSRSASRSPPTTEEAAWDKNDGGGDAANDESGKEGDGEK